MINSDFNPIKCSNLNSFKQICQSLSSFGKQKGQMIAIQMNQNGYIPTVKEPQHWFWRFIHFFRKPKELRFMEVSEFVVNFLKANHEYWNKELSEDNAVVLLMRSWEQNPHARKMQVSVLGQLGINALVTLRTSLDNMERKRENLLQTATKMHEGAEKARETALNNLTEANKKAIEIVQQANKETENLRTKLNQELQDKWKNYLLEEADKCHGFVQLRNQLSDADCEIICQGKQVIYAHNLVLVQCPYFASEIARWQTELAPSPTQESVSSSTCESPKKKKKMIISLEEFSKETVDLLLDSLYGCPIAPLSYQNLHDYDLFCNYLTFNPNKEIWKKAINNIPALFPRIHDYVEKLLEYIDYLKEPNSVKLHNVEQFLIWNFLEHVDTGLRHKKSKELFEFFSGDQNDPAFLTAFGVCHSFGIGTDLDKEKARKILYPVTNFSYAPAKYFYGSLYEGQRLNQKDNYSLGYLTQAAAEKQFARACWYYGRVRQNKGIEHAKTWYVNSVKLNNHPFALGELAQLVQAKKPKTAFELAIRAANQGAPACQYLLATYYRDGVGCDPNIEKAREYAGYASAQGHLEAGILLQSLANTQ